MATKIECPWCGTFVELPHLLDGGGEIECPRCKLEYRVQIARVITDIRRPVPIFRP